MAEEFGKKRKRIKVKKGESVDPSKLKSYTLKKDKGGRQVYEKTTTTTTPLGGQSQYREPTAEEKSAMAAGTFYSKNPAQYREGESDATKKSTERIILTKKEPKVKKEKGESIFEKIKSRIQSNRAMREVSRKTPKYCR